MRNKITVATVFLAGIIVVSCKPKITEENSNRTEITLNENVEKISKPIPYTEAKHYFVKNTYINNQIEELKITNSEEFYRIFGMATVMGKDGMPTPIDFSKQYVLAVIDLPTEFSITLKLNTLKQENDSIIVDYQLEEGEKQSYTSQSSLVILVNQEFKGEPNFQRKQNTKLSHLKS